MRYKYPLFSEEGTNLRSVLHRGKQKWFCWQGGSTGGAGDASCKAAAWQWMTLTKYSLWTGWGPPAVPACQEWERQGLPARPPCTQPAASPENTIWTPQHGFQPQPLQRRGNERRKDRPARTPNTALDCQELPSSCELASWQQTPTPHLLYCSREKETPIKKSHSSYPVGVWTRLYYLEPFCQPSSSSIGVPRLSPSALRRCSQLLPQPKPSHPAPAHPTGSSLSPHFLELLFKRVTWKQPSEAPRCPGTVFFALQEFWAQAFKDRQKLLERKSRKYWFQRKSDHNCSSSGNSKEITSLDCSFLRNGRMSMFLSRHFLFFRTALHNCVTQLRLRYPDARQ